MDRLDWLSLQVDLLGSDPIEVPVPGKLPPKAPPPPIQIGYSEEPRGFKDILFNLSPTIPTFITRFKRIIEIVSADEAAKTISRDHFREYRKKGFEPQTHNITHKA